LTQAIKDAPLLGIGRVLAYEPPHITTVWPDVGETTGGTPVYLTGTGMMLGLAQHIFCKFGNDTTSGIVLARVISPSTIIRCVSPPVGAGTVQLRVSVDGLEYFGGVGDGPYFHYHARPQFASTVDSITPSVVSQSQVQQ